MLPKICVSDSLLHFLFDNIRGTVQLSAIGKLVVKGNYDCMQNNVKAEIQTN